MKKLLLNSIVAGAALLASVNASAQTEKFYLGVTGYSTSETTGTPVTVDATVYSDYSFVVGLPSKTAQVNANNATIDIKMTDVASLGVSGTRSISKTITTGITGTTVTLSEWLENCYDFKGVTCPVTVKDGSSNQTFIYTIGAATAAGDGYTITGTPSSSTDAAAAWKMITANVTTGTQSDDSYLTIPAGTYIQIGNEKLTFDTGYDYLKGSWTLSDQMDAVKDNASLSTLDDVTGTESYKMILYLPVGTTLALGSSYATLNKEATITIDASDAAVAAGFTETFTGVLSSLRTAANSENAPLYQTIYATVQIFDEIVGLVDEAGNVPITVQFGEEVTPAAKFYFGVTGYTTGDDNSEVASTVDFTVYGDYSFVAGLPVSGSEVDADKARVYSYMKDVESLKVVDRSFDKTITTGITGVTGIPLDTYLSNAYKFAGATCPVTVIDGTESQSFTYYISAVTKQSDGTYTITGTPSSTADASTAWHMITDNVTSDVYDTSNDIYLRMKKGAFLQLSNERAMFNKDCDLLSDDWDSSTFLTEDLTVKTYNVLGSDTYRCVIYFPADCQITMDDSYAKLNTPVAVIVDGTSYKDGEAIEKWISSLISDVKSGAAAGVYNLITIFNNIIGLVDAADGADITVMFNPVLVDIFKTAGNAVLGMEMDALTTLQDIENNTNPDPNAVAQLVCGTVPEDAINLVYTVESSTEESSTEVTSTNVCDNLVITDKYPVNIPEIIGGFTATSASYSRENTNYTNKNGLQAATICLPFPVTSTSDVQFYKFDNLNDDETLMTFTEEKTIEANTPAAYSVAKGSDEIETVEITEENVTVPATEVKDYTTDYLTFTGVQTKTVILTAAGDNANCYYVAQNKFWLPITNDVTVYPQRAYFVVSDGTASGVKSYSISFGGDDDTTGISAVQNADNAVVDIYSVNGVRQSGLQKGVNIVRYANGQTRKVIVK